MSLSTPQPALHPRLELAGITKAYPGVVANSDISLSVQAGEIHAVLGENGAGKSTLMKIIYGSVQMDAGSIEVDGRAVRINNPREARALGVAMVFQHFNLFHSATVAENVWLGLDKNMSLAVDHQPNRRALRYDRSWPLAACEQSLVPTPSGQLRFPKADARSAALGASTP